MTTNYPGELDSFSDPQPADKTNSATVPHAQQHHNINDAVEAIESELGTNPSGSLFATVRERFEDIEEAIYIIQNTAFDSSIIPDLSITANKLAANSITNSKIVAGAVTADKIGAGAISPAAIAADAITKDKVAADVAGSGLLQNGDGSLSPNVDNITIEISGGALRIKNGGIASSDLSAALIQALVPTGTILATGRTTAPDGYALCDGSAVSRTGTYGNLFAAIGTAYGDGNGTTTFNLPNHDGRIGVGLTSSVTRLNTVGKTGGEENVTLTTTTMPAHSHTTDSQGNHQHVVTINADGAAHTHNLDPYVPFTATIYYIYTLNNFYAITVGYAQAEGFAGNTYPVGIIQAGQIASGTASANHSHGAATNVTGAHGHNISSTGTGDPHENMPPFIVHRYIIKL